MSKSSKKHQHVVARVSALALSATLATQVLVATTFMSVEPIPGGDVVGDSTLATIESAGYENLELWSTRLLNDCGFVSSTIRLLTDDGAISTVNDDNTDVRVAAGGFEGTTHPSFVFTMRDSGLDPVSGADVDVLDNALGYVLNQEGTVHFSPDNFKAYAFALDYAVVTFPDALDGVEAQAFFAHVGNVDPALFTGQFAGFTQITNNSLLFLKPAASKNQFIAGLSEAASTTQGGAIYSPLKKNGAPTTARAGINFPGNDWMAFPNGDEYLSRLGTRSADFLSDLAALREAHLDAVDDLVLAIRNGTLFQYLGPQFSCPTGATFATTAVKVAAAKRK